MAQMADALGTASYNDKLEANNGTPDQLLESLGRLSKKAGVLATIVLDRTSGAILTTTGSISPSRGSVLTIASPIVNTTSSTSDEITSGSGDAKGVDQMASLVWSFVNASAGLVQGLDAENEVKLLRLRTKKYELVVVPDSKYLLVVVHETPSA